MLFNNAGVSLPPLGSVSAQGHELQMATNCLGHYLLTQILLPTLLHTVESAPRTAVRVIWTSSILVDLSAPKCGINISDLTHPPPDQQKELCKLESRQLVSSRRTRSPGGLKGYPQRDAKSWGFENVASRPCTEDPGILDRAIAI